MPPELVEGLKPEYVSPLVLWLAHEECPESGSLYEVGCGYVCKLRWERTLGKVFDLKEFSPESIKKDWSTVVDFKNATHPESGRDLMQHLMGNIEASKS
jgi:3-hydroxyacyl-CoA dehydrogenase/3a,7a,12a-trihydroxy-5b-cholest-24-enoyl-CoA hydratase